MTEVLPKTPSDLTDDQKLILRDIYQYRDKSEYTEADLEMARKMFDTPEKFTLLRKIFGQFTQEERGITMPHPLSLIDLDPAQATKYAFETAVSLKVDETVRQMLVQFYRVVRGSVVETKKEEFKEKNQADFEESKRTEAYEEAKEEEKRTVGENL